MENKQLDVTVAPPIDFLICPLTDAPLSEGGGFSITYDNIATPLSIFDGDVPFLTFFTPESTVAGKLWGRGGVLSFEGNAEESAKIFFEHVIQLNREFMLRSNTSTSKSK